MHTRRGVACGIRLLPQQRESSGGRRRPAPPRDIRALAHSLLALRPAPGREPTPVELPRRMQ
jgi:hypothetical protein